MIETWRVKIVTSFCETQAVSVGSVVPFPREMSHMNNLPLRSYYAAARSYAPLVGKFAAPRFARSRLRLPTVTVRHREDDDWPKMDQTTDQRGQERGRH